MQAFVSWSGGKDTFLACYNAMKDPNIKVRYLLNMVCEDGKYSRSHGISSVLLEAQSKAIGIPIVQRKTSWNNYEIEFKKAVLKLKKNGIDSGIFGDIDFQEHRDWIERVCKDVDIKPIFPLWKQERKEILGEFINAGFKAIVVATNVKFLDKEWLGKEINKEFMEELKVLKNIDLCGEKGEYHTFVYNGPIFKKPVKFIIGKKTLKDKHWFLELVRG